MDIKKFAIKNPDLRQCFYVNMLGILYFALFVAGHLQGSPVGILAHAALYISLTNSLLMLASLQRWLWRGLWLFVCISGALADYFMSTYGINISTDTMVVFFQATPREVDSFSKAYIILHLVPGLLLAVSGFFFVRQKAFAGRLDMRLILLAILLVAFAYRESKPVVDKCIPYNYLSSAYSYYWFAEHTQFVMKHRTPVRYAGHFDNKSKKPLMIVLVIGESARADHFSLNGYARPTNPLLSQMPNLVNFPDTTSCGTVTWVSVPCLMSRSRKTDPNNAIKEASIISVFNKLKFQTAWFGAQGVFALDDPINFINQEAQTHKILIPSADGTWPLDEELLPYLERSMGQENAFIVLHTSGSHIQYIDRYSNSFEKFKPVCAPWRASFGAIIRDIAYNIVSRQTVDEFAAFNKDCEKQGGLVNAYDNTIVYTDWFLSEVIKRLQDKNALFVYVSDHGESLGENGKYLHMHPEEPSNWHVPMVWWASDEFIKNNPQQWERLGLKSKEPTSHSNIYHSLLGCAGVDSPLIDKSLNLCQ